MAKVSKTNETLPSGATSHRPLMARPGFWLILALVVAAPLGAVQWQHPQSLMMAAGLGGGALLCLMLALWAQLRGGRSGADANRLAEFAIEGDADGLLVTDRAGKMIYANPAFHKLLSFAAAENPSRRVESLDDVVTALNEADAEGAEDLRRLIATGLDGGAGVVEFAVPGRRLSFANAESGTAWRRLRVKSRETEASRSSAQSHMFWRVSDITDHREIEAIRRTEEARTIDLLDFLPVGVFSADAEGVILYANQTLARWLGAPPEHLVGMPFADYVAGVGEDGEVTLRDAEGRTFATQLEQSQKDTADGDIGHTRSIIIRNQLWNDPTAIASPCAPATPKASDSATQGMPETAQVGLHGLFDEAPVGMVLLDLEGQVSDANRAFLKMLGRHRDVVVGLPFADNLAREDRGDMMAALSKIVMGTARAAHMEVRMPGASAREFILSLYASRLIDAEGEVSGMVLHLIDNTEQKNLEVQFAQSQKMQAVGQLAGGVAHDFNNLLTAMIGFCDLLLERHGSDDPSFADIQQIRQNANRATNLVRQLLAFSRKQTLEPVRLDITEGLNDLASLLRRLIGEKVELTMAHGRDLLAVKGDKSQFDQIIINLCVNARDAMPGGGDITVSSKNVTLSDPVQRGHDLMPPGRYVQVDVADTGTGISKEHMERIFEPFFTTKDAGAGTGLGLSTVYGIVHQTGGFIFVDSAPGEGTTFSIYLPEFEEPGGSETATATATAIAPASTDKSDPRPAPTSAPQPSPKPEPDPDLTGVGTVLLVEDEDAVRMFANRALSNKGYTVLEAANGEIALDVVSSTSEKIDIIVSDVIMPGMDGHTLVGLVRQELPGVKVILMSGYAEDMYRDEIGRDNTLHFLGKPFTLKDLAAKVKEVLAA
jgi:two-component system, cell cycle sensor histidine kinase and response regulator CckA